LTMVSILAGRFRLIRKDDKELVVHIFGGVEKKQLRQKNVDFTFGKNGYCKKMKYKFLRKL